MYILSIDVGIINLGLVYGKIEDYLLTIEDIALVDITKYQWCKCTKFDHEKKISNYMKHVFEEYNKFFTADVIIIERQPLCGIVSVEQIICYEYPKSVLVSPNAVHKHFNMSHLTYNFRKMASIKIAKPYLEKFENYNLMERKHDLSDCVLMILFYNKKMNDNVNMKIYKSIVHENDNISGMFDSYTYTGH